MKIWSQVGLMIVALTFFNVSVRADESGAETAAPALSTGEAAAHIGQTATVCGVVASSRFLSDSERKLTFLNLDEAYPNQVFDVMIEFADREKFSEPPERYYRGKRICVTGLIEQFKDKTQIRVTDPGQISVTE